MCSNLFRSRAYLKRVCGVYVGEPLDPDASNFISNLEASFETLGKALAWSNELIFRFELIVHHWWPFSPEFWYAKPPLTPHNQWNNLHPILKIWGRRLDLFHENAWQALVAAIVQLLGAVLTFVMLNSANRMVQRRLLLWKTLDLLDTDMKLSKEI